MEIIPSNVTYPSELRRWTIVYPAEHLVRYVNQTGGNYFAILRLSVEPYNGPENVIFVNDVGYKEFAECSGNWADEELMRSYIEGVREGVEDFLRQKAEANCPIAHLLITLTLLCAHPVDSSPRIFRRTALIGMEECFAKGGLIRIDE